MYCEWKLAVAEGNKIRFLLEQVDNLASDFQGSCTTVLRNYVEITDGDDYLLRRYCQKETSVEPIIADNNELVIKYKQNGGSTYGGLYGFIGKFSTGELDKYYNYLLFFSL